MRRGALRLGGRCDGLSDKDRCIGPSNRWTSPLTGKASLSIADRRHRGTEFFTRNGSFQRSETGELVTAEGHLVQGQGGPIVIPPNIPH